MKYLTGNLNRLRSHFSLFPYTPGTIITLNATGPAPFNGPMKFKILKLHTPSTHSVIIEAAPLDISTPSYVIVKLYDSRFSHRLRSEEGIDPATRSSIREYLAYANSGGAKRFAKRLERHDRLLRAEVDGETLVNTESSYPEYLSAIASPRMAMTTSTGSSDSDQTNEDKYDNWGDDGALGHWTPAQNETYLFHKAGKRFAAEKSMYYRLRSLQGTSVPKVYAPATLKIDLPGFNPCSISDLGHGKQYREHKRLAKADGWTHADNNSNREFMSVKALILEHIPGFSLSDLCAHAPRCLWTSIIDDALEIVHQTGLREVLNEAARPNNFIVSPQKDGGYRVVMTDFSESRVRHLVETDEDWGRAKWCQNEIGIIGDMMGVMLRRVGYDYHFNHRDPRKMMWWQWAP